MSQVKFESAANCAKFSDSGLIPGSIPSDSIALISTNPRKLLRIVFRRIENAWLTSRLNDSISAISTGGCS
jgi:hypothetical protein